MTRWINPRFRACLFGVLLAVLAGCNDSNNYETLPESTFDAADDSQVPAEPVTGIVTADPDTKLKTPKTDGGKATPIITGAPPTVLIDNDNLGQAAARPPHIDPPALVPAPTLKTTHGFFVPENGTRFMETSPDTTGGATFQSSAALEYDLGNLVAMASSDSSTFSNGKTFISPVKG